MNIWTTLLNNSFAYTELEGGQQGSGSFNIILFPSTVTMSMFHMLVDIIFPRQPSLYGFLLQVLLWSACVPLVGGLATLVGSFFPRLYSDEEEKKYNNPVSPVGLNNLYQWLVSGSQFAVLCHYLAYIAPGHVTSAFQSVPNFNFSSCQLSYSDIGEISKFSISFINPVMMCTGIRFFSVFFAIVTEVLSIVLRVVVNVHVYDLAIYCYHYAGHKLQGSFVYNAHRMHHENSRPASFWNIIYGDLWEGGTISFFAWVPVLIAPISLPAFITYLFFIVFAVSLNHTGRDVQIPYIYNARYHQEHHISFTCNYSEHTPLWDMLFGTYRPPRMPVYAKEARQ